MGKPGVTKGGQTMTAAAGPLEVRMMMEKILLWFTSEFDPTLLGTTTSQDAKYSIGLVKKDLVLL
jgi:hypothetical protein